MAHQIYMGHAIQQAKLGGKMVKTNPNVGCIIVFKDRVIGEGFYQAFGEPHAEVNAINSVKEENRQLINKSTMYVSLEPCCIHRKTPACTDLILKSGIKKVVISCKDPNPDVAGKGIELLKSNGIEVITDILSDQGEQLINPFKRYLNKRPYIILKWAQTKDNYIGHREERVLISNKYSNLYTHQLRAQVDGILVGKTTALSDNPSLTTRHVIGENPVRIILDAALEIPLTQQIYNTESQTIIINEIKSEEDGNVKYIKVKDTKDLDIIAETLFNAGIFRLLVEGGKKTLTSFIDQSQWDEAHIITASTNINNAFDPKGLVKAPFIKGHLIDKLDFEKDKVEVIQKVI